MANHFASYDRSDETSYTVIHLRKPESSNPLHEAIYSTLGSHNAPSSPFEAALFRGIGKEIAVHYLYTVHDAMDDTASAEILGKESVELSDAGAFSSIMQYLTNGPDADIHDVRIYQVMENRLPEGNMVYVEDDKLFLVAGSPAVDDEGHQKPDTLLVCQISIDGKAVDLEQGAWEWKQTIGPESEIAEWYREVEATEDLACWVAIEPWVADAEMRLEEDKEFARRRDGTVVWSQRL